MQFARTAPRGIAVVEVFRGKRKIGIARTRVRRGGSKRVKVKLTPTGRRLLRRSNTKRLKVRVRGARRAHGAALEDADDPALGYRIERYRSSSQGVTWTR